MTSRLTLMACLLLLSGSGYCSSADFAQKCADVAVAEVDNAFPQQAPWADRSTIGTCRFVSPPYALLPAKELGEFASISYACSSNPRADLHVIAGKHVLDYMLMVGHEPTNAERGLLIELARRVRAEFGPPPTRNAYQELQMQPLEFMTAALFARNCRYFQA